MIYYVDLNCLRFVRGSRFKAVADHSGLCTTMLSARSLASLATLCCILTSAYTKATCPFPFNVALQGKIFQQQLQDGVFSSHIGIRDILLLNDFKAISDAFDRKTPYFDGRAFNFIQDSIHMGAGMYYIQLYII